MSLPGFFLALAGATLIAALGALWLSLRSLFGGRGAAGGELSASAPGASAGQAALV